MQQRTATQQQCSNTTSNAATQLAMVVVFQVTQKFNTRWTTEEQLLAVQGTA